MPTTVKLLSTYNGYKPGDIIVVEDSIAAQLLPFNATTNLTGGTQAYKSAPGTGLGSGESLPLNQTISQGQTLDMDVPSGVTLGLSGTSNIAGNWSIVNPDGSTSGSTPLSTGQSTLGVFIVDTKVRFNVTFGSLTVKPGVVAGSAEGNPIYTQMSTLLASEDGRGFGKQITAANVPVTVRRLPTATAGAFVGRGDVNLTQDGAAGQAGAYLDRLVVQVEAGGDAGVYITQLGDPIFAESTVTDGAAITNTTTQTLKSGPNLTATIDQLAGRVVSAFYVPTGGVGQWFTSVITSNKAPVTNTIELTLRHAWPAGAAPTRWIIHGARGKRVVEPARAARDEPYVIPVGEASLTGGFQVWTGPSVSRLDAYVIG